MILGCALLAVTTLRWLAPDVAETPPDPESSDFSGFSEPSDASEPSSFADVDQPPDPGAEPLPGGPPAVAEPGTPRVRASARDGFGLDSADGRFRLSLGLLGQLRLSLDQPADEGPDFSLRLARVMIQGRLWGDRVVWQIQPEFAGDVRLLDINAIINVHPAFAIYVGQYRPWFTRGFSTILPLLALPDRGTVLDTFRIDRDVGVTLMGQPFDGRMEYYVGVLDGEGIGGASDDLRNPQPLLTARLVGAPLGSLGYTQTAAATTDADLPFRFAFAANAATNEVSREGVTTDPVTGEQSPATLPDLRTLVVGGDLALQGWRMMAMGEGWWRQSREIGGPTEQAWGTYAQVSGVIVRQRLELALRGGAMRLEADDTLYAPLETGLNVYAFGDHAKVQLRYRCTVGASASGACLHGGDLQAQLWF